MNSQFRFLFLILTLLTLTHSLRAQRTLGVKWEAPENRESAIAELVQFNRMGISLLEVQSELSPVIWQKIDSLNFEVYGSFGIQFPITSTFSRPDSLLIKTIQHKATTYLSQPSVTAIGLFEYGATHTPTFFSALDPIARQLRKSDRNKLKLYCLSRSPIQKNSLTDFTISESFISPVNVDSFTVPQKANVGGYLYTPSGDLKKYLSPFKRFIKETSYSPQKVVFLHSEWLLKQLDKNPQFAETIHSIATEAKVIFPLPKENLPSPQSSALPIIVLLLVWGMIGAHYNTSPLYRKSLFRYFTAHRFFVNAIFQREIRSLFPAFIIIFQHALLISACFFATFSTLFSTVGQAAFFHYFPSLAFLGSNPFSIFAWTFIGTLLISFLSIIWLFLTHRKINTFTQVAIIYAWPLQLNFIFCTVAITLFSAGSGPLKIIIFTILPLLLFILSFVFTSIDTFKLARSKPLHLIKTSIPYLLAFLGLGIWILTKQQWIEIISLSLNLK